MTFLPIVVRELRVASRRRGTYWHRLGAAMLAIFLGGWIMLAMIREPKELGMVLFIAMSIMTFIFCVFAGLSTTADCLAEEKREGTLGLLFLTDLKGYDIVLGKLFATSLNAFYALLAVFPVMAISLLMGGVAAGEFWRVVLVGINNLLFALALGIFASSISRDERKAVSAAFVILLVFAGGFPALGAYVSSRAYAGSGSSAISNPDPFFLYPSIAFSGVSAFDASFKKAPAHFWGSLITVHCLAWAFLASACTIVPRSWQDKALSAGRERWRDRWRRWLQGDAATRKAFRVRLLEMNPFLWLAARDRLKPYYVWAALAGAGLIWLWGRLKFKRDWIDEGVSITTAFILHTALKLWLGSESSRRLAADRRSGALELLLSTPLKVYEILQGQLKALARQFAGPAFVVLLADFCFLMAAQQHEPDWYLFWLWIMGMLVADLVTLSWVGMWSGLRSRSINRASGEAVLCVLVVPWVVFLMFVTACLVFVALTRRFSANFTSPTFFFLTWFLIGIANDVFWGIWAAQKLLRDFRTAATERYGPRPRWWSGGPAPSNLPPVAPG